MPMRSTTYIATHIPPEPTATTKMQTPVLCSVTINCRFILLQIKTEELLNPSLKKPFLAVGQERPLRAWSSWVVVSNSLVSTGNIGKYQDSMGTGPNPRRRIKSLPGNTSCGGAGGHGLPLVLEDVSYNFHHNNSRPRRTRSACSISRCFALV
jgi:hypothetical protein